MSFDFSTLVTDRLQSDVDARNGKGTYNAADLNRVTACTAYLNSLLEGYGYQTGYVPVRVAERDAPELDPYTWYDADIPTQTQMEQYLGNVRRLRQALAVENPPVPDSMERLTYQQANAIEQALLDLETTIAGIGLVFPRAGTAWAYAGTGFYFKNGG